MRDREYFVEQESEREFYSKAESESDTEATCAIATLISQYIEKEEDLGGLQQYFEGIVAKESHAIELQAIDKLYQEVQDSYHETSTSDFVNRYKLEAGSGLKDLQEAVRLIGGLLPIYLRDELLDHIIAFIAHNLSRIDAYDYLSLTDDYGIVDDLVEWKGWGSFDNSSLKFSESAELLVASNKVTDGNIVRKADGKTEKQLTEQVLDKVNDKEPRNIKKQKGVNIWNHLTISRDNTSASNFAEEVIPALGTRVPRFGETAENSLRENHSTSGFQQYPIDHQRKRHLRWQAKHQELFRVEKEKTANLRTSKTQPSSKIGVMSSPQASDARKSSTVSSDFRSKEYSLSHSGTSPMPSTDDSDPGNVSVPSLHKANRHSPSADDDYEDLRNQIASLQAENQILKGKGEVLARVQVLYYVIDTMSNQYTAYLEEPNWTIRPDGDPNLTANSPVTDTEGFLNHNHDIAFVVGNYYQPLYQESEIHNATRAHLPLPRPKPGWEALTFYSKEMVKAAESFFGQVPDFLDNFPRFNIRDNIAAPYMFWYHYRGLDLIKGLNPAHKSLMLLVTSWIENNYKEQYDNAIDQLERGVVSKETIPFLFKPGGVIIREKGK
jgi:hypothetical protein